MDVVRGFRRRQVDNEYELAAETADTQFLRQPGFLLGGVHAQKTHGLVRPAPPRIQDVQLPDRAEARTQRMEGTAKRANILAFMQ